MPFINIALNIATIYHLLSHSILFIIPLNKIKLILFILFQSSLAIHMCVHVHIFVSVCMQELEQSNKYIICWIKEKWIKVHTVIQSFISSEPRPNPVSQIKLLIVPTPPFPWCSTWNSLQLLNPHLLWIKWT